jgi:hypothetical protein
MLNVVIERNEHGTTISFETRDGAEVRWPMTDNTIPQ